MSVNQQRLAEIGIKLGWQMKKIGDAYADIMLTGEPPPEMRNIFLEVANLAKEGARELKKIQSDSALSKESHEVKPQLH